MEADTILEKAFTCHMHENLTGFLWVQKQKHRYHYIVQIPLVSSETSRNQIISKQWLGRERWKSVTPWGITVWMPSLGAIRNFGQWYFKLIIHCLSSWWLHISFEQTPTMGFWWQSSALQSRRCEMKVVTVSHGCYPGQRSPHMAISYPENVDDQCAELFIES